MGHCCKAEPGARETRSKQNVRFNWIKRIHIHWHLFKSWYLLCFIGVRHWKRCFSTGSTTLLPLKQVWLQKLKLMSSQLEEKDIFKHPNSSFLFEPYRNPVLAIKWQPNIPTICCSESSLTDVIYLEPTSITISGS